MISKSRESSGSVRQNDGPGGSRKTTGQPEEVCGKYRNSSVRPDRHFVLSDVSHFFVAQSHSIDVSRWSALGISSHVVLLQSLCICLRVESIFRGLLLY